MNFESFLWSLTQQESGGNYGAVGVWVNGDRAYGRYQVMGANIPSWTRQYYGRTLTPQQYLNSREAQDAVVRGRLQSYVNKYGYRGAASAWYSGNASLHMSTRSQPGGPSIKGYVDSIMNRANSYTGSGLGGGASGGGGGGYTAGAPVQVKLDRRELAERYGLSSALINSSKELSGLFNKAVAGSWSATRFQAELKNSKWWRSQSSTLRKYLTTRATDPATHKQRWANAQKAVNQLAVSVGLGNQINGKARSSKLLRDGIYNKLALGWSDARLKDWFGARAQTHGNIMWGEAGDAWDKLHEVAYLNGMKYSAGWYKKSAVDVVSGKGTLGTYEDEIRRAAAAKYKAFAPQIMAGQNAMDLAAPYIKAASTLLELPETDVDLFNKHIYSAMAGGKAGSQFPLWDFENQIRNDPAWRKTNNARESMMTVARQVAKDFGMAY
ncbi:hypothetical protein AS594_07100 [Streptomyces agglomeratus]|uniref:Transglycosylase SLT domain-containing protein n=1 Tax=Streptomyces agglomeratus TaxID=285458 RepID=A0A1E5P429_9ACTN|nr:hypothetical protein [Streptomyces agglomeratus]OEJ24289.1 hypothetical protein AS594_07100 [Streptomyces agglomeratus]